ncbi:MAG: DUF2809 domain-containing protein [Akkermansiaceae bacterium]|jgi:hypothetical protein|nr:DUF2809 domain-containing protein [Akkermansiaceae bacterium]
MPASLSIVPPRTRALCAGLVIAVAAAGLLWRSKFMPQPLFAAKYGGDALWTLMVFCALGCLFPGCSTWRLALLATGCSWGDQPLCRRSN